MRYRSNYNTSYNTQEGEYNQSPSMTVPDMSLSIQEIMRRHVQGRPLPKSRPMFYGGDTEYPPAHAMSYMDTQDMLNLAKEQVEHSKKELEEKRKVRKRLIKSQKEMAEKGKVRESEAKADDTPTLPSQ